MRSHWKVVKTLEHRNIRIEFMWLMEDMSDEMSDSPYPEMERNPNRNRIASYDVERNFLTCSFEVPQNIGNHYYKAMREHPEAMEFYMDQCYLDVAAYHDDFDCYSDTYKDINGIRPHYTQSQWDTIVSNARNMK